MHSVKLALLGLLEYYLDSFNDENKGTVTQVDNVSYEPSTSLKMIQTYDSSWTGRYHSEAIKTHVYTVGDQGFYGFAFRIHSEWDMSMMWVEGSQLRTRRKGNNMCGTNGDSKWTTGYDYEEYTVGTIQAGVWLNGTKKVEEYNVITTYLYANWHDQGKLVGSDDRRLWINEVGIGSTFADADPDQWLDNTGSRSI
ncbi:putative Polysaccharide lyase [Seiridium unicorne]|uniref:Polysaccharide lyase n=1 Tax=Seiridium unicorne TaxID=138068 RepID=A0ABR2UJR6_9PEZI